MFHQCFNCGKENNNYYLCNQCIDQTIENLLKHGTFNNRSEILAMLWDREENAYITAKLH